MWLQYRPDIVRQELQVLAEHGCTVTRSFCYWPDFVPEPRPSTSRRSSTSPTSSTPTLTWASRRSRRSSSATCLVRTGTRRGGRVATYRDVWLVSQQAWFVGEIVRRFHGHAVAGWLLSNEMPIYGGPASTEEVTAWARILVQAARAAGATQPISIGDGAWGVEVSGTDNGYLLRSLAPLVDFFGPHSYLMEDDQVRQFLAPAFTCELAGSLGKPVVLEEFGVSCRLRRGRPRRRLLPAGAAHIAAGGSSRVARLEQLRLRRPPPSGPVPPPRLRAPLRTDRRPGTTEAQPAGAARLRVARE